MSTQEILSQLKSGTISVEEAGRLLDANGKGNAKRTISKNKSDGLFVRDESFKAFSAAKNKTYTASANIQREVAKSLFTLDKDGKPSELLKAVCDFVATM